MIESDLPLLSSIEGLNRSPLSMRIILEQLSQILHHDRSWSRAEIYQAGERLLTWRTSSDVRDLWESPPTMVTATLDDAIGQGLRIIHLFSHLAGMHIMPLGLMRSPRDIITTCDQSSPDILGLTILQFPSEETLGNIIASISPDIQVIAGGPIFKSMTSEERHSKNYTVLNDIRHYIDFLLLFEPQKNMLPA